MYAAPIPQEPGAFAVGQAHLDPQAPLADAVLLAYADLLGVFGKPHPLVLGVAKMMVQLTPEVAALAA